MIRASIAPLPAAVGGDGAKRVAERSGVDV